MRAPSTTPLPQASDADGSALALSGSALDHVRSGCRDTVARIEGAATVPERWASHPAYLSTLQVASPAKYARGNGCEWKDATALYTSGDALAACVDDLAAQVADRDPQCVAGIGAAGFVLGAALAYKLKLGFVAIRKGGSLACETDAVTYSYSKARGKQMEVRCGAFAATPRVLLVDQWVASGGSMRAAIELVHRNGGAVAAIAAMAIERNAVTSALRADYHCATAVPADSALQADIDRHVLDCL